MVQKQTMLTFVDNSGARRGRTLFVYGNKVGIPGKLALVSMRKVVPNNAKKLKKGDKLKAVIVKYKKPLLRTYGDICTGKKDNCAVLLKKGEARLPLGTRVFSKIAKEVRYAGYVRMALISRGLF